MTARTTPQFSLADAVRLARATYGLVVTAVALPSERDQNFALATTSGSKFVLKIAKSDEELAALELQNAAIRRSVAGAPGLTLPHVVATPEGEDIVAIAGPEGQSYFMRLLTWVDGELLVRVQPHTAALRASLGSALAELDLALLGFSHPAMRRELHWDVRRADLALRHLPLLPAEQQLIVGQFMDRWFALDWAALRHGVIHGDANDYNVLVRDARVSGFLDFGDTVYSALVCNLAIALAYAMLDTADPMAAAVPVIQAYHARLPLTSAEIAALYPLAAARLCMSVCYAAYNARMKSADPYQQVTAGPAAGLLRRLSLIPEETIHRVFWQACEAS